jgi:cytochrome oxidase assembly protein ShyY1
VLRLLVTPRWLALTGLILGSVALFLWLGAWQWGRVYEPAPTAETVKAGPIVDVSSIYSTGEPVPDAAVGQLVRLTGEYNAAAQLLVPHHEVGGPARFWVLTPLELADGSVMPVVRGWSEETSGAAVEAPSGAVVVDGWLSPPESDSLRAGAPEVMPEGQVAIVSSAELLSLWDGPLYQGFVTLRHQRPASELPVVEPLASSLSRGLSWQNLAYAVQWWLFAGFAIFFWWRMFQIDLTDQRVDPASSPDRTEARS